MARLVFNAGDVFTIGGSNTVTEVFGSSGVDTITIAAGAKATLFGFSSSDAVSLGGNAGSYTAVRSGSSIVLTDAAGGSVTIPVSTTGQSIAFGDATRTLVYNTTSGNVELGGQAITTTAATVTAGTGGSSTAGQTFTLTVGKDVFTGGAGDDKFSADAINPVTGAAATTLTATDALDGGAGNDTLNITVDTSNNATIVGTYANIETINIDNTTATSAAVTSGATSLVASGFVGATNINQIGKSANVTGLASTTTATFTGVTLGSTKNAGSAGATATYGTAQSVAAGSTATSASIVLSAVKGDSTTANAVAPVNNTSAGTNATTVNEAVLDVSGASLASVTVAGTLKAADATSSTASNLVLNVTGGLTATGASVSSLTVNTAVKTTLNVATNGSATAGTAIATVDASGSTGAVKYLAAANTVAVVKGGSASDTLSIQTATAVDNVNTAKDETISASISGGAGNDSITVNTSGAGATAVDGGDGNDTITLTALSGSATIAGGAGNDTVKLAVGQLVAGVALSGGDGTDTLELSDSSFTTANYLSLEAYTSGFESVTLTGDDVSVAVNKLRSEVTKVTVSEASSTGANGATVTGIDNEAIVVGAAGKAALTALGYDATNASTTGTVYGSSISASTATNSTAITAKAASIALGVSAAAGTTAQANNVAVTLDGDVQTASVSLTSTRDVSSLGVAQGTENVAKITIDLDPNAAAGDAMTLNALTSFTVTGAGEVVVDASNGSTSTAAPSGKLDLIDLSGMTAFVNLDAAGDQYTSGAAYGYENLSKSTVTLNDANAEVVKLGGGDDTVVTASTFAKMDVIEGYELVALASSATSVDSSKSDGLDIAGRILAGATDVKAITISSSATTLAQALLEAGNAVNANNQALDNVVFHFGGDTYFYGDDATAGYSDNDVVLKLVGTLNLTLLAQTIA